MKNKMIKYPVILGTIALIAGLLLALVYNVTAPVIEKNRNKRENAVVLEMFGDSAKIIDNSESLTKEDKDAGITSALKVNSSYYVYKITFADSFDGDESSLVVALDSTGKIYKLKFTETGDSYASSYNTSSYESSVKGKNNLTSSDTVSGATKTGNSVVKAINAAIAHKGRVK